MTNRPATNIYKRQRLVYLKIFTGNGAALWDSFDGKLGIF